MHVSPTQMGTTGAIDTMEPMCQTGSIGPGVTSSPCKNRPDENKPCAMLKKSKDNNICLACGFLFKGPLPPSNKDLKYMLENRLILFTTESRGNHGPRMKNKCQFQKCNKACKNDFCSYHSTIVYGRVKTAKRNGSYTGNKMNYTFPVLPKMGQLG